jgi:hypothetical protein
MVSVALYGIPAKGDPSDLLAKLQSQPPSSAELDDSSALAGAEFTPPTNRTRVYTLSIVRLADPEHAELAQLNATTADKQTLCVCGNGCASPGALSSRQATGGGGAQGSGVTGGGAQGSGDGAAAGAFPACTPNSLMWLNVSHETDWVSLHPGLRWPGVPGLRVEVNGQVSCACVSPPLFYL